MVITLVTGANLNQLISWGPHIIHILQILYIYIRIYIFIYYICPCHPLSLSRKDSTGRNLISYWLMAIPVSGWLSHVKSFQTCFFSGLISKSLCCFLPEVTVDDVLHYI
jgi:hypothetical protein